jgi:hypothetical protein
MGMGVGGTPTPTLPYLPIVRFIGQIGWYNTGTKNKGDNNNDVLLRTQEHQDWTLLHCYC